MKNKTILGILIIIILCLSGCGKSPNSHLSYLPENTAFIVSAQLGAIMEKADYQSALDSKAGQFFFDQLKKEKVPSIFKKAITNPQEMGLDLNSPTYLFAEGFNKYKKTNNSWQSSDPQPMNMGMIVPVLDAGILANKFQMVSDLAPEDQIDEKQTDKFHYLMIKERNYRTNLMKNVAALGYNSEVAIFVFHDDKYDEYGSKNWLNEIETLLDGSKPNDILKSKPGIGDLGNYDLGFWADLTSVGDVVKQELERSPKLQNKIISTEASYVTAGLKLDLGLIGFEVKSYLNDEMKKQYNPDLHNQTIGKDLVNKFPNDPMAGLGFAINLKEFGKLFSSTDDDGIKETIEEIERVSGLSLDKLVSIPSGNALAVLYDINLKRNDAEYAIGLGLNDPETLIKLANEKGPFKFVNNEPIPLAKFMSVFFNDKYLFLSSPDLVGSLIRGNSNSTFESEIPQKPSSSNLYAFADANQFIREIPANGKDERMLKDALLNVQLGMIDAGIMSDKYSLGIYTNIRLKNTESNPLSIISEIALETIGDLID